MIGGSESVLVADVGGTHSRFGLWDGSRLLATATWPTPTVPTLATAVDVLRARWRFGRVAAAVAGPVQGRRATLTNAGWSADLDQISLPGILLNDLEAAAWGCGAAAPAQTQSLTPGLDPGDGAAAVLGVGTGLGAALWFPPARAVAGEGGHAGFAPRDEAEHRLALAVEAQLGRPVECEDLVSGPGLGRIVQHIAALRGQDVDPDPIVAGRWAVAEQHADGIAAEAVAWLWSLLGAEVRNTALRTLPPRGVFIVGGLMPRLVASLNSERFAAAVVGGGPLAWRLRDLAVTLVADDDVALRGAAAAADWEARQGRAG